MANIDNDIIGKKIEVADKEEPKTNIDLNNSLEDAIIEGATSSSLRTDVLESFSTLAQNRESEYELIDTMAMDSIIASALSRYAEDITQTNDKGQIFWIESNKPEVGKYVTYLLNRIDFDRNAYRWAYSLVKYGDVYVRLVRKSEFENSIIFGGDKKKGKKENLSEDVNVIVNSKSDHYADTLDTCKNPNEMFELTKFGKTIGFIKAPVNVQKDFRSNNDISSFITYKMRRNDVDIYSPTEFVHGCLENSYTRAEEELDIFINEDDFQSGKHPETFEVKRGTGVLNDLFKVWRQLSLIENSILLSRLTRSSITRAIQMEVGDMPQNQVRTVTQRVKQLLEQKSAIEVGSKMSEYVNPGPVENIVILPTKNGKGAISMTQIGGDYDPKTLTDLDYFVHKLAGGLKIPVQLLGFTSDSTGFNGGTSLTILSSDYGKAIKKMQKVLVQMVTDCLNLLLIDKGYGRMVNNFRVMMQPPVTQEEIDKKSDLSNSLRNVSDIMNALGDVDDKVTRLTILKSLLSDVLANQDINSTLQDYIDKLKQEAEGNNEKKEGNENNAEEKPLEASPIENSGGSDTGGLEGFNPADLAQEEEGGGEEAPTETEGGEAPSEGPSLEQANAGGEENLPSGEELGVDLTDSTQFGTREL